MIQPETSSIDINGFATRVWRKGTGPRIGFLAGYGGLPKWIPFLDRLAESRTVVVPSLPGFPGGDRGHTVGSPRGVVRRVAGAIEAFGRGTGGGGGQDDGVVPEDGGDAYLHVFDVGAGVVIFGCRQLQSFTNQAGELSTDAFAELFEASAL